VLLEFALETPQRVVQRLVVTHLDGRHALQSLPSSAPDHSGLRRAESMSKTLSRCFRGDDLPPHAVSPGKELPRPELYYGPRRVVKPSYPKLVLSPKA
jgi:hypothetical protein